MKGGCVMMRGEQNSLEEDREGADERATSAPPLSSATEPNPHGEAHPHLDPMCPRLYPPNAGDQNASARRYSITLWRTCEPLSRERGSGLILNEPNRRSPMRLALVAIAARFEVVGVIPRS